MPDGTYTHDQVSKVVTDAGDLVARALDAGERDRDLIDLVVNAATVLLTDPDADFGTVIERSYETFSPQEVRSWWTNWD